MKIEQAQVAELERGLMQAFEARTLAHLHRYFPRHCSLLGDEQMRQVIRHGLAKANQYGLTPECCVVSYVDLMCLLGGGFDTDGLLPWAADLLNDRRNPNGIERGDALYDRAWQYINTIARDFREPNGTPTTARFVFELKNLREESDAPLASNERSSLAVGLEARLKRVFPTKCQYVGELPLRRTIATAFSESNRYGIRGARGLALYTTMTFILGASFSSDPLLPWAKAILNDASLAGERQKVDKLFMASVHVLRQWWEPEPQRQGRG